MLCAAKETNVRLELHMSPICASPSNEDVYKSNFLVWAIFSSHLTLCQISFPRETFIAEVNGALQKFPNSPPSVLSRFAGDGGNFHSPFGTISAIPKQTFETIAGIPSSRRKLPSLLHFQPCVYSFSTFKHCCRFQNQFSACLFDFFGH